MTSIDSIPEELYNNICKFENEKFNNYKKWLKVVF